MPQALPRPTADSCPTWPTAVRAVALLLAIAAGARGETLTVPGGHTSIQAAIEAAASGDLIVVSTQGHAPFRKFLVGSFAERVARVLPCPVLTVRDDGEEVGFSPKRILWPFDGSELSRATLPWIRELTREGARCLPGYLRPNAGRWLRVGGSPW